MKRIVKTVIICLIVVFATLFFSWNYLKSRALLETFQSPEQYPEINRGKRVLESYNGNLEATMYLARYYGSIGIYEAQLFWLKRAHSMGEKQVSKKMLESVESGIIDEWR